MGSVSVSSCRCCIFVSCVHPVPVINAAFCMNCSLLILVEDARGDHLHDSTAEYAAPVWERSAYAHLLNPELNQACRAITGCLKPTNVENLYLLAGIAPPEIRRSVCARVEITKQVERETHALFGHTPARRRLKLRKSFLTSVQPVHFPAKVDRVNEWKRRLEEKAHAGLVNLYEDLATGHDSPWLN